MQIPAMVACRISPGFIQNLNARKICTQNAAREAVCMVKLTYCMFPIFFSTSQLSGHFAHGFDCGLEKIHL
jgi:hypothetical protein